MKLRDKALNFYIKNIKHRMECPSCYADKKASKMRVDRKKNSWVCDSCGYTLSCAKFEEGITFWFCDSCGAFLNKQEGFAEKDRKWRCTKCGYDNDVTEANIVNECIGCGKRLPSDYKPLYCPECKAKRAEKIAEALKMTSELCCQIADSLDATGDMQDCESIDGFVSSLETAYEASNNEGKEKIDKAVCEATGKKLSDAIAFDVHCANCGNVDSRTLFDEGDTIYCSRCSHRTRKSDGRDDLVICPVCRHLKDRKATYCRWCNNADPKAGYSPREEELANEFEAKLTPDNIRYYNLKGKRKP